MLMHLITHVTYVSTMQSSSYMLSLCHGCVTTRDHFSKPCFNLIGLRGLLHDCDLNLVCENHPFTNSQFDKLWSVNQVQVFFEQTICKYIEDQFL